ATRATTIAAAAAILLITACSADGGGNSGAGGHNPQPQRPLPAVQLASSLRRLDTCDDLRSWARDELAPRVGAYGFSDGASGEERGLAVDLDQAEGAASGDDSARAADVGAPAPTVAGQAEADLSASGGGAPAFSETNVQVEGVDEPDIVKTDGERILTVANGRLHLASAGRDRILDSVALPEGMYDAQLLLAGDRAIVFASADYDMPIPLAEGVDDAGATQPPPGPPPEQQPSIPSTRVVQIDIDGDTLTLTDSFELDGSYVSARMTGDVARLVLHADPQARLPFVTPAAPNTEAEAQAKQHNQDVVEQAAAEDLLPTWRQVDSQGNVTDQGPLLDCEGAHAPNTFSGFGMVAVVTVDLSDGVKPGIASATGSGVLAGGQTVYASTEHLYVAAPEWVDWSDQPRTLPRDGGDLRIAEQNPGTDIHRFDISDPTRATYDMSGHVDGQLLDQFAMDEHDGYLRVATTTGQAWLEGEGESESHVVVLAPGDGALTPVGQVSGLGRGETIQSVRFLGAVGYVVTFEQTDPLYTVDLSDPAAPRVAGELKILGFSAYLHPIGDGRLIGVGQDATEDGQQLVTQVALFDVRDPAAPTRVAQATLPNSSSGAEWDHHAFLWWPDASLVAIPVSAYDGTPFEGLVGYTVDVDGATITERGRIVHPSQVDGSTGGDPGKPVPLPIEPGAGTGAGVSGEPGPDGVAPELSFPTPIMRSLVIGDRLWTLSSAGLASSDLTTLGSTTFVPFA
ncbi:MAG: beta-propeller domain-containing protein, partial [Acidimicrobiales bacterium]